VIRSARVDCEMRAVLPATLQAAEEFFIEFRRSQALLDRLNRFAAELLVREALTNAVVHDGDRNKPVRGIVPLRLKSRRLLIAIEDDGDGFNWHAAWDSSAAFPDSSGRGIAILRAYASRVRFSRGNRVTIIRRF